MDRARTNPREAINVIKANFPDERYSMLRDSCDLAIEALEAYEKSQQKVDRVPGMYENIGTDIGKLVDRKNAQYGDSINNTAAFLRLLYPDTIPFSAYRDLGILVRMYDKMKRIASGNQGEENAYNDIAGYAILMSREDKG